MPSPKINSTKGVNGGGLEPAVPGDAGFRAPIAEKLAELRKMVARIEATPRKGFTPAQRKAIHEAQEGQCAGCEAALTGRWDIDHAVTIWDGGAHEPGNWIGLCVDCHKIKTARDAANRAHTKRIIRREEEGQPTSRLQGRGFDSNLTRGFDGKTRPRQHRRSA